MQIRSYAEVHRRLLVSEEYRRVCGIESVDKVPHPSTWTRFRQRVGAARLQLILGDLLRQLAPTGVYKASAIAVDPTFIKAYSKRDPKNNTVGFSDPEARLRIEGRNVTLGYGVHLAADTKSEMPLAAVVEPANVNEKKVAPSLLHKTVSKKKSWKSLVADSQYSSEAFRDEVRHLDVEPVIPYPRKQMKHGKVLRVDRKFRSHGPAKLKRLYRRRSAVERAISRLKHYFGLKHLRTRGLRNVLIHTLLCSIAMLTIALSSILHGHTDLMRSPVSLMKLTGKL